MTNIDPILAVIPARGGSKGLPRKNIRPLAGRPLIGHSLECAQRVPRIARTIVTTDDAEIASVAQSLGAAVPFLRPTELARDDTPMMPVMQHALLEMERIDGIRYGSVLLLDPTSPGRLPSDIESAAARLEQDSTATGVVACSQPRFNPFWVGTVVRDGYLTPAFADAARYARRQDVPPFYRINGALYLWRRDWVAAADSDWSSAKNLLLEIPELRAFSIDDAEEFHLIELMLSQRLVTLPWVSP